MNKMLKLLLTLSFVFLFPSALAAQDFGLLLNQYAGFGNADEENQFEYKAGIVPRFSKIINHKSSFNISASISVNNTDEFLVIPELLRTEFSAQFDYWGLRLGRFLYSDPLGFVVSGLFDGIQLTHTSSSGRIGFGAWYTGLQYKKSANITMTENDLENYSAPFDYSDFANTYFAPSRLFASFDYENYAIGELLRLRAAVIGQFDFSDTEKLNSQYLIIKMGIPAADFLFELGGSLEMIQPIVAGNDSFNFAFAGDFGIFWTLPAASRSRLSFNGRMSGGYGDDLISAFVPITNTYYGEIFQAKMSSLSVLALNYSTRISSKIGTSVSVSYFMRHDLVTQNSYPIADEGNKKSLLGAEVFARMVWSPVSDLQFNLGGGAFIPALGDNWPNEKPIWRIDLSAVLAIL